MIGIYYGLAAFISWWIALSFVRANKKEIVFNSIISSVLCGILTVILNELHYNYYLFLIEIILFLLMLIIVHLQVKGDYGDLFIIYFIAHAINSMIIFIGEFLINNFNYINLVIYILFILIIIYTNYKVLPYYPVKNWREYYSSSAPEPNRIELKEWYVYSIVLILGVISTIVLTFVKIDSTIELFIYSIILFIILLFGILLLCLMHSYKKERISLLLEQQYREEMQIFLNVIRSQRHDYNFHVQAIAGLIQEGKLEECAKYVNALEKDSSIMNSVLPLKDPAISSMIHNFQMMAVRAGVVLNIDIQNDLAQIATSVYETNKIISNLLQNALDEVSTHKDKSYGIWLNILKRGEFCVIKVSNKLEKSRSIEEIGRIYQQGYTTKQGHEGVGLSAIKALIGRYKGTIYTNLENDIIHFVAKVPISYSKKIDE